MAFVGKPVPGLNNALLAAGAGTFVGDLPLPGGLTMAVLRSPHPHARLTTLRVTAAEALPGVVHVVTGAEIRERTNPIPPSGLAFKETTCYALAGERVRYVGEPVAAVVAEDAFAAHAALELVETEYEPLPAVTDAQAALAPAAALVEPPWGDNVLVEQRLSAGEVERAFAESAGTASGSLATTRVLAAPLEPRGAAASWEPHRRLLTCWSSTQTPHTLRHHLASALGAPESELRLIQPQVGGAFGGKLPTYPEDVLVCYLARRLGRPVRWIEERHEHLRAAGHSRDIRCDYEAAYLADGTVTGLRVRLLADVGAPATLVGWLMSLVTWSCIPGPYRIGNVETELRAVVTNKSPWQAYRGFGKDSAAFFLDRIMEHVARATGLPSAEVRLRNFIQKDEFPFTQVNGVVLDSGDYAGTLRTALDLVDEEAFRKRQAKAREQGRFIGLGLGQELTPEGVGEPGSLAGARDTTHVRVGPGGDVVVLTGVTSPGSGNETGIAQIVADSLGCELSRVRVVQGDTETCPFGSGNFSSRSLMLGGSAAMLAARDLRDKLRTVAASMLEVSPEDVEAEDGTLFVRGSRGRAVAFDDVVAQVYLHPHGEHMEGVEPSLEATRSFKIGNVYHQPERNGRFNLYPTWSNASAACEVEVDPETGVVRVLRYVLVHDSGRIVNPLLAAGQLHGAITQGIGAALYEFVAYDEAGRPLPESLMDYTLPTASEWVRLEIVHHDTPSPFTPLGTKGVGESGISAPTGAIAAAIEDALPHLDLQLTQIPFTPSRVWTAIQQAAPRKRA